MNPVALTRVPRDSSLDNYCHYDKIFTSVAMIESTSDFLDEVLGGIQKLKFFDPIFKETLTASICS